MNRILTFLIATCVAPVVFAGYTPPDPVAPGGGGGGFPGVGISTNLEVAGYITVGVTGTSPSNVVSYTQMVGYVAGAAVIETDPIFGSVEQTQNWNTAYGWGDHGTAGYLTSFTELDPVFDAVEQTQNWNTAYGWGDHGTAGYLTSETDPLFDAVEQTQNWNTAYGWGDHSTGGYLTSETDPVFSSVEQTQNWNTAYGWGDHSTEGYLTSFSETDPVFDSVEQTQNWNTAYGWGDHSTEGYLTAETDPVFDSVEQTQNWNTAYGWGDHSTEGYLTSFSETDPVFDAVEQTQNWNTAYGWGDHSTEGYLTSETDPLFGAVEQTQNWNTAYGWGDHSTEGYLTSFSETDPVFDSVEQTQNWNTAYGWGDHSTEGYLTSETDPVFSSVEQTQNWNTAYGWGDHSTEGYLTSFTELDPVFDSVEQTQNWNTAYGWGDHSTEGYLTSFSETDPVFDSVEQTQNWNTAYGWGDHSTENYADKDLANVFAAGTTQSVDGLAVSGAIHIGGGVITGVVAEPTPEDITGFSGAVDTNSTLVNHINDTGNPHETREYPVADSNKMAFISVTGAINLDNVSDDPNLRGESTFIWDDIDGEGFESGPYLRGYKITDGQDIRVTAIIHKPEDLNTNEDVSLDVTCWVNENNLGSANTTGVWQLNVRYVDGGAIITNSTPDGVFQLTNNFASTEQFTLKKIDFTGPGANWTTEYVMLELYSLGTNPSSTFDKRLGLSRQAVIEYTRKQDAD